MSCQNAHKRPGQINEDPEGTQGRLNCKNYKQLSPLPVTISLKNSTDSVNSSALFPLHLTASDGTALSSKYTPIAVNFTNFPWISNPLTPAHVSKHHKPH